MTRSNKRILIATGVLGLVVVYVGLVRPELKYQRAVQKYKPGTTAKAIEEEYGVHLDLQPSGNILPYTPTEEEKRRHWAYEARIPEEYLVVSFNSDQEVIDVTKLTPLQGIQKLLGLR